MPTTPLTATDLFSGAGGSSLGLTRSGRYQVRVAINHNAQAIASHAANLPDVDHHCVDISQADPGVYPPTDLVWASPECTTYSPAHQPTSARRRGDRRADGDRIRSRATGFDLLRWLERHRGTARYAVAENVVQWRSWTLWPTVVDGLARLGYRWQVVYHNAALTGQVATWRDRMYLVCWDAGLPAPGLTVTADGMCPTCGPTTLEQRWKRDRRDDERGFGRYRNPAHYTMVCPCGEPGDPTVRTAADVHQRDVDAHPVFGRPRELVDDTVARLVAAVQRWGRPQPGDPDVNDDRRQLVFLNWKPTGSAWPAWQRPLNTITGIDSHGWVDLPNPGPGAPLDDRQARALLDDATYRMLTVSELADAMGFGSDYRLSGTDRQQRIQVGLAVCPPVATWLAGRLV